MPNPIALPLAVAALLVLVACGSQDPKATDIAGAVQALGYTAARPPTQLTPPGTVVAITSQQPFQARVVCSQTGALGDVTLAESATQSSEWSRQSKARFGVSADVADRLNAKFGAGHLKEISLSLSNTKVFELSDEELIEAATGGHTTTACLSALEARRNNGDPVTMIRSVLQADVVYTLHFATDIDAQAKLAYLKAAAPELLARYTLDGTSAIKGDALYFGIIDDVVLLRELVDHADPSRPALVAVTNSRRLIGPEVRMQY